MGGNLSVAGDGGTSQLWAHAGSSHQRDNIRAFRPAQRGPAHHRRDRRDGRHHPPSFRDRQPGNLRRLRLAEPERPRGRARRAADPLSRPARPVSPAGSFRSRRRGPSASPRCRCRGVRGSVEWIRGDAGDPADPHRTGRGTARVPGAAHLYGPGEPGIRQGERGIGVGLGPALVRGDLAERSDRAGTGGRRGGSQRRASARAVCRSAPDGRAWIRSGDPGAVGLAGLDRSAVMSGGRSVLDNHLTNGSTSRMRALRHQRPAQASAPITAGKRNRGVAHPDLGRDGAAQAWVGG